MFLLTPYLIIGYRRAFLKSRFLVSGEGQVAGVQLSGVEGGVSEPLADELCDISAQHMIRFDNLNPYTYMQRSIAVKNNT